MKTSININSNRKKLSDKEIMNRKPEFSSMLKAYHSTPKPWHQKIGKWWVSSGAGMAVIAAIVMLAIFDKPENEKILKKDSTSMDSLAKPFVYAPAPEYLTPEEEFLIDPTIDNRIETKNGTELSIPANAFSYPDGKNVVEKVKIKFKDYYDPFDIFLSGIPMSYDSNGSKYHFESAGMIGLFASANQKPIELTKGKNIDIKMITVSNDSDVNLYYLDTLKRNWQYLGKPNITALTNTKDVGAKNNDGNKDIPPSISEIYEVVKPRIATSEKYVFKLSYNKSEFPELSAIQNPLFEVINKDEKSIKQIFSAAWSKKELKHTSQIGTYVVSLKNRDTTLQLKAIAVCSKGDYEASIKSYTKSTPTTTNTKEMPASTAQGKTLISEKVMQSFVSNMQTSPKGVAVFSVSRLGYINCDTPLPYGRDLSSTPYYTDASGKKVSPDFVYGYNSDMNSVINFDTPNHSISLNSKDEYILWALSDGKIGIIYNDQLKQALRANRNAPKIQFKWMSLSTGMKELENNLIKKEM